MKWLLTHRAWQDYQDAPASVQKAFDKQIGLLAEQNDIDHENFEGALNQRRCTSTLTTSSTTPWA